MYSSQNQQPRFDVTIIGGGFSGVCVARQLLATANTSLRVAIIERGPCRGRGAAYSTQDSGHLLNVPASNMSALSDDPDHFLEWARLNYDSGVQPGDFLPRRLYGDYSESLLTELLKKYPEQIVWKRQEAISLTYRGDVVEVALDDDDRVISKKVVLALGNFPPCDLRVDGRSLVSDHITRNPWTVNALEKIPADGDVLLVGSGLTSVDMVISLRSHGFRGTIHMLSRHGLLPRQHTKNTRCRSFWSPELPKTARGLLRTVRESVPTAEDQADDWRSVIDSLRSLTPIIWQSLSLKEQSRFLRHLRPYWDAHRHRIAPEIGKILHYQLRHGQVQMHAGRITGFEETSAGAQITYRDRQTQKTRRLQVDHVINCTGPQTDCRKIDSPLLSSLLRQGLVRPDPLLLGLDCSQEGALIDTQGVPSDHLFTVGPSRKGNLWESVAVPELRAQAYDLASLLAVQGDQPYERTFDGDTASAYSSAVN